MLTFLTSNAADLPAPSIVPEHRENIQNLLAELVDAKAGQRPDRASKATLLDALLLDFKRISGTARGIELRSGEVGFSEPFNQVPDRIEKDITIYADKLLSLLEDNNAPVAEGGDTPEQKTAKATLRQRFLALSIKASFVTDLRHDRDALDHVGERNIEAQQKGTENTAAISEALSKLSHEIDILDPVVRNVYEFQPEKLHAWERASRVERDPKRSKKPEPPPAPTPPPA